MSTRAIFLDRDGTLNRRPRPHHYVTDAGDFELLDGAAQSLARLARAGWQLIVVSNQRGVALGLVDPDVLSATEQIIQRALAEHGCRIGGFYYCTHDLDDLCPCRKPRPGLLLAASHDHDIDLSSSWMVGDSRTDEQAGKAAGCRTIRLGKQAEDLAAAAALIVEDEELRPQIGIPHAAVGRGSRG